MQKRIVRIAAIACLVLPGMDVLASPPEASFVVFGDSGYIPSYEQFDDDDVPMRTLGEYLAVEAEEWLERNPSLDGFTPTPWTFESALGSFVPASGMYPVAWAMDDYCSTWGCDFAAMVGDNIYPDGATLGADGISDARRFRQMLDQPFGRLGEGVADFRIYAMLGNHDWRISREAALAQMAYLQQHPKFEMPDLFYRVSPPGLEDQLELFVIDTEMLLAGAAVHKDNLDEEGREFRTGEMEEWDPHIRAQTDAERNMVPWLEDALASSSAKWKIVIGHHALWSGGGSKFEKARSLRELYLPILCRHADAYFSGDDHVLEAYTDGCEGIDGARPEPLPVFVSGAASKYRPLHPGFMARQAEANPQIRNLWSKGATWGFMHARTDGDTLIVRLLTTPGDSSGRPVLEAEFSFPHRSAAAAD
nr:metallophosphoesterase [Luteimonas salinisoli]